ncbi:dihydrofolate reductase family protein [Deinococcus taeanensis]|uniref:dihydrofolate reductase family protein n=1 Tax=Deinococcus taeanensis TaxID=2737050 RepID=UPI001CDC63CC|nr:dihydrofolate reductase family protein [Deinococcus taeanensis]UBV42198.1 dihydrofolate reductase family protein [Deinococcus taeanensis]
MTRFRVFIATSLDGFIARLDGALNWLPGATPDGVPLPPGEDHGFGAFMAGVEVVVMGRGTFEAVRAFDPWPYAGRHLIVLSRTLGAADMPERLRAHVGIRAGPVETLAGELRRAGVGGVYVDGGQVIQAFLRAGLIDELIVTRVPVLLGQGRPLFGPLARDLWLEHVHTRAFPSGLVQSTYRPRP